MPFVELQDVVIRLVPLSEVCEITMGQAPVGSSYNENGEGYALIAGAGDFGEITPEPKKHTVKPTRISRLNDLILCIRATIGDLNWSNKEYCLGRGVAGLRPINGKLDKNYLWHFVDSNKYQLKARGTGSTFKQVSRSHIEEWEIPLPPIKEQKRIAAILDKADAIRRKRQQAINLTDQLLRSVFLEMFGDPVTNPKGWVKVKFDDLGVWASGGTPARKQKKYFMGDIDWYSAGELNTRYVESSIEKITESAINESAAKIFKSGSILLGMYDTAAFKQSILKSDSASNQACANLNPNETLSVEWFYTYISISKEHYLRLRRGVRQKNLNLGMIKEFELPLPPKEKQLEFERICQKILTVDSVNLVHNSSAELLFQSLTQQAFNGQRSIPTQTS